MPSLSVTNARKRGQALAAWIAHSFVTCRVTMRRLARGRHACVSILPALLICLATTHHASASPPPSPAELAAWQQRAERVTITRDEWGIPHIHGKSDADAVFGLIYAQAEDDFNRIEMNYLSALGRTAETEGEARLFHDLRMRLVVDEDTLRSRYATSPDWLRSLMHAWADGLNYYLATHPQVRPKVLQRFRPGCGNGAEQPLAAVFHRRGFAAGRTQDAARCHRRLPAGSSGALSPAGGRAVTARSGEPRKPFAPVPHLTGRRGTTGPPVGACRMPDPPARCDGNQRGDSCCSRWLSWTSCSVRGMPRPSGNWSRLPRAARPLLSNSSIDVMPPACTPFACA